MEGGVGASLTGAVITEEINSTPSHPASIHPPPSSSFHLSSLFQNTSRETLVARIAGRWRGQPQTCLMTSRTSRQLPSFPLAPSPVTKNNDGQ